MPGKVLQRTDKKGFATPEEHWLRADPGGKFREAIIETACANPAILSPAGVETELRLFHERRKPFSNLFWRILTFGVWVRRFGVQS